MWAGVGVLPSDEAGLEVIAVEKTALVAHFQEGADRGRCWHGPLPAAEPRPGRKVRTCRGGVGPCCRIPCLSWRWQERWAAKAVPSCPSMRTFFIIPNLRTDCNSL